MGNLFQPILIDSLQKSDWPALQTIYLQGIATGIATFEEAPPPGWDAWRKGKLDGCCLAARSGAELVGWAALTQVSSRRVYHGVAEVSLYVAEGQRGHGVGKLLLQALVTVSEMGGIWTLQAGIITLNHASIHLHQAIGFRLVGVREKLGLMTYGPYAGQWLDVAPMERRSPIVNPLNPT